MQFDEQTYHLITKYLNNQLRDEQLKQFETRLAVDDDFRKTVELQKDMNTFFEIKEDSSLQSQLKELGAKHFIENQVIKPVPKNLSLRWLSIAASILLISSLLLYFLLRPPFYERAYRQFAHSKLSVATKGIPQSELIKMETAFNSGNYQTAIPLLKQFTVEKPTSINTKMALAISYLETDQFAQANQIFTTISQRNSSYKDDAVFYLGLSYLRQGKLIKCKEILSLLPEEYLRYKDVKSLMEQIDGKTAS